MTYQQTISAALAHEKDGHWRAAELAWHAAAQALREGAKAPDKRTRAPGRLAGHGGARVGASGLESSAERFKAAGVLPGDTLTHRRWGHARATCTYFAPDDILYNGASYGDLTAAGNAAARDLGLVRASSGWMFWGLEKPESPTFTAEGTDDGEDELLEGVA
ncbi:MAG: hypothetical protein ABI445_24195 [Polyangia bacterium]